MMVFLKALLVAQTVPKIVKNSIAQLNFYQKFVKHFKKLLKDFQNVLEKFPRFVVLVQRSDKITEALLTFLENMLK